GKETWILETMQSGSQNVVQLFHDLPILETQHAVAACRDDGIADPVPLFLQQVNTAVELDDQPFIEADKIGGVGADQVLALEVVTVQPMCANAFPEQPFGSCRLVAHRLRPRTLPRDGVTLVDGAL